MADLSSGRFFPDNPALLLENVMTRPQAQPGERQPLRDLGDGQARPERGRMPGILVVEDHAGLQRQLLINLRATRPVAHGLPLPARSAPAAGRFGCGWIWRQ
jgi:hypothetical protein